MSGSLVNGAAQLREAAELLERAWAGSERGWRDVVRERFETERLDPLRKQWQLTQVAILQLADVLNHAKRAAADAEVRSGMPVRAVRPLDPGRVNDDDPARSENAGPREPWPRTDKPRRAWKGPVVV